MSNKKESLDLLDKELNRISYRIDKLVQQSHQVQNEAKEILLRSLNDYVHASRKLLHYKDCILMKLANHEQHQQHQHHHHKTEPVFIDETQGIEDK